MKSARITLLIATALVGLSAGFFFAYEVSVTRGLALVSDVTYVETFQAINDTIRSAPFGIVFFGSVPALAVAIAFNWRSMTQVPRLLLAAALPLYLAGLVVTVAIHIPLNNDLGDQRDLTPQAAGVARADFEDEWNRYNLLRTLAFGSSFVVLAASATHGQNRDDVTAR